MFYFCLVSPFEVLSEAYSFSFLKFFFFFYSKYYKCLPVSVFPFAALYSQQSLDVVSLFVILSVIIVS